MKADSTPGIENALKGNYDFTINTLMSEAWEKTKGFKGSFWAALVIVLLISGVGFFIIQDISNMIEGPVNSAETGGGFRPIADVLKLILSVFISTPLAAGLWMLAIRRSVDMPVTYKSIFQYFSYWKTLWAYPVIFAVLGAIDEIAMDYSIVRLIVLALMIFAGVSYFLFVPLVVEKKLGTWEALETSRKVVFCHWFKFLWLMIVFTLIACVSIIPAGIALIWSLPWIYCAMGILYRDIIGVVKA